ncbi:MAG: PIN domain-containing protein [Nocardioidaceae bacterium]
MLLSLSAERLYRPLWGSRILEELEVHEQRKLEGRGTASDEAAERAARLVDTMRSAFDDALVTGWEQLDGTFGLPDPDDEHVVATAVISGADVIVTENVKDMPRSLVPDHIDIQTPQKFAANTITVDPLRAMTAVRNMVDRYQHPPMSFDELLDLLTARYGMNEAAKVLKETPG